MANSSAQKEAAGWVREVWLPRYIGQAVSEGPVRLTSGGQHKFPGVSDDGSIVATVSTSAAETSSGKLGVGKLTKVRADMYFLLLAGCTRRIVVLTDPSMYAQCLKEREEGRVPASIEFVRAELPPELAKRVLVSRDVASREVRPARSDAADEGDGSE
jgi:hypothetical protein